MYKTLSIIKNRAAEFSMILFFTSAAMLLFSEYNSNPNNSGTVTFIVALGTGVFLALSYLFQLGFLRTVAISGDRPYQPKELLFVGKSFIKRIILVSLAIGIVIFILWQVILAIIVAVFLDIDKSLPAVEQLQKIPKAVPVIAIAIAALITVRFWLYIPAVIIVYNCQIKESVKLLKSVRFFQARETLIWLILFVIFNGIISFIEIHKKPETSSTIANIAVILISTFLGFMLHLAAVEYIKTVKNHISKG